SQAAPGLAQQWVERAMELNPVNPLAARLNWSLVGYSEDRGVRVQALLRLVQADPASLPNVATLADQLAKAGFYDAALTWYAMAIALAQRGGVSDAAMIFDYAAELFIGNNALSAGNLVTQLLQADPRNVDALFLCLLPDRDKPSDMRD